MAILICIFAWKVLKQENVAYVVAPYEADAQMTFLAVSKLVDAVITEDSDLIPFGCPRVCCFMGYVIFILLTPLSISFDILICGCYDAYLANRLLFFILHVRNSNILITPDHLQDGQVWTMCWVSVISSTAEQGSKSYRFHQADVSGDVHFEWLWLFAVSAWNGPKKGPCSY